MNRKMLGGLVLTLGVAMALAGCSSQEKNGKANQKVLRIGVSSYDQYDTFVSELISCFQNYAKEKEKENYHKPRYPICAAKSDGAKWSDG